MSALASALVVAWACWSNGNYVEIREFPNPRVPGAHIWIVDVMKTDRAANSVTRSDRQPHEHAADAVEDFGTRCAKKVYEGTR